MKKMIMFISALICSVFITSCGHGGNSSSGGINFKLPNGSTLSVPASGVNLTAAAGKSTSTAVTLSGGSSGMGVLLSSSVTPSGGNKSQKLNVTPLESQIVVTFTPKILTSGTTSSSTILVAVDSTTPVGTYLINLKASYDYQGKPTVTQSIGIISIKVSANPNPAGTIAFSTQSQALAIGQSAIVTLVLSGSTDVSNVTVHLASESSDIATVSPDSCTISTESNTCNVTITAVTAGATTSITAKSDGYTITPMNVIVTAFNSTALVTTFATFNGVTYGYVTDFSNTLWQCPMDTTTGGFSGACTALTNSTAFSGTTGVKFETFNGTTYGYVTGFSNTLWQCPMDATTGGFSGACTALTNSNPAGFGLVVEVTFESFNGTTYGYVADLSNNLWQCPIDTTTGGFSGACTALTNSTDFSGTTGVTFETFNGTTYGYVVDNNIRLWQCPMNATGGFSGACTALTDSNPDGFGNFFCVNGITFDSFAGTTYGYVADFSNNLWQCPMNATGGFSGACTALTNSGTAFVRVAGVTFESFNGTTYGYVVDWSNALWQCPMNATGGFSGACTGL